jgi:uncharacterized protein (DUF362 family)
MANAPRRVAIARYEAPHASLESVVERIGGLARMPTGASVFIKPNIVFWTRAVPFPKWGVVTTSRVVEDMVALLTDHGAGRITIGEGIVTADPKDTATPAHAFDTLGYGELKKRYGVEAINIMARPFETVDLGDGIRLNYNVDILHSDFVVDLPVMKAHNQTVVSLGIKNLKGCIDIPSRKRCHSADPHRDLHFMISRLADPLPPMLVVYDGIYTNERGPGFDGKLRRSNVLMAASDVLSGDLVGARVLGHDPVTVPHLVHAARHHRRPLDLSDVKVVGTPISAVASVHAFDFEYTEANGVSLPLPLSKQGVQGLSYRKYDTSMCTYCSGINGVVLSAIRFAWKGEPFDDVEVLTGKMMDPTPGRKKTLLLGKCMYQRHRKHPDINEMIAVKGCPPKPKEVLKALQRAGINADPGLFEHIDQLPALFMSRYADNPDFDEAFFRVAPVS